MVADIQTLRDEVEALNLKADAADLRRYLSAADIVQRTVVREATGWGSMVPAHEYPSYERTRGRARYVSNVQDRERGGNRPHLETEWDLWAMQGTARWLAGYDSAAIGVIENLTSYILGTGFDYQLQAKPRFQVGETLLTAAQSILDQWQEDCLWRRVECEGFQRAVRDGEWFMSMIVKRDGRIAPRFIEPEHIREPLDSSGAAGMLGYDFETTDWSWGIASDFLDSQDVRGYYLDPTGDGAWCDFKLPHEVEHCKLNVDAGVKRGISDFYAAACDVERAGKLNTNIGEGAAIQAAIALIRKGMKGTSKGAIESARSLGADFSVDRPTQDGSKTNYYEHYAPGRIHTTSGMDVMYGPMGTPAAAHFISAQQMILRRVGQRWAMPEYMVSGDASNANYASTLVAESPFVKRAERQQQLFIEHYRNVIWRVLTCLPAMKDLLYRAGLTLAEFRAAVQLNVQPPRVSVRNRNEETGIRSQLNQAGILSKRTWAGLEELDHEAENENIKAEQKDSDVAAVLNGAQITAAAGVLTGIATGTTAPAAAVELLVSLGIGRPAAQHMVRSTDALPPIPQDGETPALSKAMEAMHTYAESLRGTG